MLAAFIAVMALIVGVSAPAALAQEVAETDSAKATDSETENREPETSTTTNETSTTESSSPSSSELSEPGSAAPDESSEALPDAPALELGDELEPLELRANSLGLRTDRTIDGDWKDLERADNPKLPQVCGLNVALVFDLSNSIGNNGLSATKQAGRDVINALAGTPTTLGLFNFGTDAPVANTRDYPKLNLSDANQVRTARGVVDRYTHGGANPNDAFTDWGGTNWEGALKNVNESGVDYDVVYFVTDGAPTTNDSQLPKNINNVNWDGFTGDAGRITHNIDVTAAIKQANILKKKGTRLEALAVGNFDWRTPVLRDDVGFAGGVRWNGSYVRSDYRDITPRTFLAVNDGSSGGPDLRYAYESGVANNLLGYYKISSNSNPYYFRLEDEIRQTPLSTGYWRNVTVADGAGNVFEVRVPAEGLSRQYTHKFDTAYDIMGSIVGPNNDGLTRVSNYGELASKLKEAATANCEGTLTVKKQIVDSDGKILDKEAKDWEFEAFDLKGELDVSLADGSQGLKATTGENGRVSYSFDTDVPHKNGTISVRETLKDGYRLYKQDGKNATCEAVDITDPDAVAKPVNVTDVKENGFNVGIGTGLAVFCTVQNYQQNSFHVSKTPHADQDKGQNGDQPQAPVKDGQVTAYYDISVTNNEDREVKLEEPVVDRVSFPEGMTVTEVKFFYNGVELRNDQVTRKESGEFEISPSLFGSFKAGETKKVEVHVTAKVSEDTQSAIEDGTYERCEAPNPPSPDRPTSMFNAVSIAGEVQGDDPIKDNQACVDPVLETVDISIHKVDANDNAVSLEGAEFILLPGSGAAATDLGLPEGGLKLEPVSDDSSKLVLPKSAKLKPGKYKLVETKAPVKDDGTRYSLLPRPLEFTASVKNGKTVISLEDTPFAVVDEKDLSIIKVSNVTAGNLPRTGGMGVGVFAVIGLLLSGVGFLWARRRLQS
ncbi:SpaA isopeptide-forming pilin-related protein [Corynebacterium aurimucosum]|uniref:SpaA isopeptide-forming pilin-related protein n=1 Tax=Corynebacterium aurimucosum TaxID=169292 RepID=UPI002155B9A4|nr:LPXTG cell wall anchor domain-containing protein [Corynebacterium aurimucosum]